MEKQIRTFIAIPIVSPEIITGLNLLADKLREDKIKWVEPDNLHITLQFIGDTPETLLSDIKSALNRLNFSGFTIKFTGLGYFKRGKFPKVLFVKTEPSKELQTLYSDVKELIAPLTVLPEENREYVPHLTLGRIKYVKDLHNFYKTVDELSPAFVTSFDISRVIFYQSILTSQGPVYRPLLVREC